MDLKTDMMYMMLTFVHFVHVAIATTHMVCVSTIILLLHYSGTSLKGTQNKGHLSKGQTLWPYTIMQYNITS